MRGRALIPPAGTISLSAGARYEDRLRPPSALEALKGATATTRARCGSGFIARSDARACSNACRQWLYRNRNRYGLNVTESPIECTGMRPSVT